jgi:hypothetical protein
MELREPEVVLVLGGDGACSRHDFAGAEELLSGQWSAAVAMTTPRHILMLNIYVLA